MDSFMLWLGGVGIGLFIGSTLRDFSWRKSSVIHRAAQYDAQSGKLKWLDGSDVP